MGVFYGALQATRLIKAALPCELGSDLDNDVTCDCLKVSFRRRFSVRLSAVSLCRLVLRGVLLASSFVRVFDVVQFFLYICIFRRYVCPRGHGTEGGARNMWSLISTVERMDLFLLRIRRDVNAVNRTRG